MNELRDTIMEALAVCQVLSDAPKEITPTHIKAWEAVMKHVGLTPAQVKEAAVRHMAASKWFPRPADFVEIIQGGSKEAEARATLAWEKALTLCRRFGPSSSITAEDIGGDEHALWAIERMGWSTFGDWEVKDRAIHAANFRRLYAAALAGNERCRYIVGASERQNVCSGLPLTPKGCGRPDWKELPVLAPRQEETPSLAARLREMPNAG